MEKRPPFEDSFLRCAIRSAPALPIGRRAAKVGPERVQNQWKSDDLRFRRFCASEVNVFLFHAPVLFGVGRRAPWASFGPDFVRGVAQ